jgi:hypothetical protein
MTTQDYWQGVRELERSIPGPAALVISIEKPKQGLRGGQIFPVTPYNAAKLIYAETHRLCTEAEAEAYRRGQAEALAEVARKEAARELFVASMPELANRVVQPVQPAPAAPPSKK